jgi:SOS response regulatory protein OraA/RecX
MALNATFNNISVISWRGKISQKTHKKTKPTHKKTHKKQKQKQHKIHKQYEKNDINVIVVSSENTAKTHFFLI